MSERTYYKGFKLNYNAPEPLLWSIIKYRAKKDRIRCHKDEANLISSKTEAGGQKPIFDLDFPHTYVPSTKPGHGHLYLDVEIPYWRWLVLIIAMRLAGQIELGYMVWSIRRGANFVRPVGVTKTDDEFIRAETPPKYNIVRKNKKRSD